MRFRSFYNPQQHTRSMTATTVPPSQDMSAVLAELRQIRAHVGIASPEETRAKEELEQEKLANMPYRSGIKTTEFWLTFIATLGGSLTAAYSQYQWAQVIGLIAATLSTMGYAVTRSAVKKATA